MTKNNTSRIAAFQVILLAAAVFIIFSIRARQKNKTPALNEMTQKK